MKDLITLEMLMLFVDIPCPHWKTAIEDRGGKERLVAAPSERWGVDQSERTVMWEE